MIRQHQFEKVELRAFLTRPQDSYAEHEALTRNAEEVLEKLGAAVSRACSCVRATSALDSAKTYDLEVWLPGQTGVSRDLLVLELRGISRRAACRRASAIPKRASQSHCTR